MIKRKSDISGVNFFNFLSCSQDPENADFSLVSSMLHQFRFLNRAKENKIAGKFFEIIDVAPINVG